MKYVIRDMGGTVEVDQDYILSNSDWFTYSSTYVVDEVRYEEYLVKGTKVVNVYKYPRLRKLFKL